MLRACGNRARCGDDAVEAVKEPLPGPRLARRPARQQIVGSEDERAPRVQQEPVGLRRCDPLQMEQIAVGEPKPGKRQGVLERLQGEPCPRRAESGREAIEAVVDRESIGLRHGAEAEARREELHVNPPAGERAGKRVVYGGV